MIREPLDESTQRQEEHARLTRKAVFLAHLRVQIARLVILIELVRLISAVYNDVEGFFNSLQPIQASPQCQATVIAELGLNIRSNFTIHSQNKGSMNDNDKCEVSAATPPQSESIWFWVRYQPESGPEIFGWSFGLYLKLDDTTACRNICPHCF